MPPLDILIDARPPHSAGAWNDEGLAGFGEASFRQVTAWPNATGLPSVISEGRSVLSLAALKLDAVTNETRI